MNILGEDLKSVLQEIGETCESYNHASQKTHTDYIDFKRYWGTRIPFENEFQVLASFPYDSPTIPGDRLKILSDATYYIVSNTTSEYFENEIITKESFMYKCNGILQVKRKLRNIQTVTFNTTNNNVECLNHGYTAGQNVKFTTTGSLPTSLKVGTTYWVLASNLAANTFEIAATQSGTKITFATSGSGVHTCSVEMLRDENFQLIPQWNVIVAKEYALLTGTLEHQHNMVDEVYARFQDKKRKLIISSQLDVQAGDVILIYPWTTVWAQADFTDENYETWQVELVEGHRLEGIKMCNLGEFTGI